MVIGRRSAACDDFGLIVIWSVLEAGPEPGPACVATFCRDVVFHGGRPQVWVVYIVHHTVGEELAFHPCGPGCWRKHGVLPKKGRLVRSRPP